jgi:hypothetical protein
MSEKFYKNVYDCIEQRLVKCACEIKLEYPYRNILISDLRGDFHNRIANLQIAYNKEYSGRETRMLVNAYKGVLKKYGDVK